MLQEKRSQGKIIINTKVVQGWKYNFLVSKHSRLLFHYIKSWFKQEKCYLLQSKNNYCSIGFCYNFPNYVPKWSTYIVSFFKGMKTCIIWCKVQKMINNPHHAHVNDQPLSINLNHCALPEHRLFGIFLKDLAISSVIWALNLKVQKIFNISQREKLFD